MFVDEVKIKLMAGNGGNGCVSFRREKFVPMGGPDGGAGGRGANIVLVADSNLATLVDFKYHRIFRAKNGTGGGSSRKAGHSGDDLYLKVPIGTQIFDLSKTFLIADLKQEGETFIVAHGGLGGAGNSVFKNSMNQAPRTAIQGKPGDITEVVLQLKMFCDTGIIGLPNAGKSTLLSVMTNANPKIADYAFTTITPNLGVVEIENYDQFTIADIPGLIEGASNGYGLGDKFLKHVERCSVLVHLISCEEPDITKSYKIIRKELLEYDKILTLQNYSSNLVSKHELIAISKSELLSKEEVDKRIQKLKDYFKKHKPDHKILGVVSLSSSTNIGIKPLKTKLYKAVSHLRNPSEDNNDDTEI